MSGPVCLGQPPLPPRKFAKVPIFNSFLKSSGSGSGSSSSSSCGSSEKGHSKLLRRYSLRKKHGAAAASADRFSCTYQSFGKDLYEGGAVVFRKCGNDGKNKEGGSDRFVGKFPYSDFCDSTNSLSRSSRRNSVNSILTLSRSHSDGNLSTMSEDMAIFNRNTSQEDEENNDGDEDPRRHHFHTFRNDPNLTYPSNEQSSFGKYLRALSGSWKNLLNREYTTILFLVPACA